METLKDKQVTTRKLHVCMGCGMKHPAGVKMRYVVQTDCGDFSAYYLCKPCLEFWKTLGSEDTFGPGDLWDEWPENEGLTGKARRDQWDRQQENILTAQAGKEEK